MTDKSSDQRRHSAPLTRKQVGLTGKEVGRLAKRHPDVIENIGGGHVPRMADFFLKDLRIGKVIKKKKNLGASTICVVFFFT